MPRKDLVVVRHGTLAQWATAEAAGAVLLAGERGYIDDTKEDVVGDGTTKVASLPRVGSSTYGRAVGSTPGNRWVALGDSLTLGADAITNGDVITHGDASWTTYAGVLSNQAMQMVYNAGIGGQVTAQMLARFDTDVTPWKPHMVTLLAGTNDTGVTAFAAWSADYISIIKKIITIGAAPILITLPPNNALSTTTGRGAAIDLFNAFIRRYGRDHGITVLDFYASQVNVSDGHYLAGTFADATHPNAIGHAAFGAVAAAKMTPILPAYAGLLPQSGVDSYNLLANGLFLTDGNSDGTADSWTSYLGSTGFAHSLVTGDTAIKGNWQQCVQTANASGRITVQTVSAGFSAGDRLCAVGRISATGISGGSGVVVSVTFNNSGGTRYPLVASQAISSGIFYLEFVIPAGVTGFDFAIQANAGSITAKMAQCGVYNLTAMGVLTP